MSIVELSLIVFINQLIFIYCRTWNVKAVADGDIAQALISGAFVHIAWLTGITIGVVSMKELLINFKLEYTPVVILSLAGGLLGTYWAMSRRIKREQSKTKE